MDKKLLTPGRLYQRLSDEFRRMRPHECHSCSMPMLYAISIVDGDYANWMVEELPRQCEACKGVVGDIVRRFSFEYDIYDPAYTTCFKTWDAGSGSHAFRH